MSKKFKKNYIIVCKKHFWEILIEDECVCQMTEGSFFQFGEECLNKIFSDTLRFHIIGGWAGILGGLETLVYIKNRGVGNFSIY